MEPIAWGNADVPDVFPAQNLLADQCHHDGVVHVVVGLITIGDILQREARNEANDVRIGGLEDPIDLVVHMLKMLDKCFDDNFCWIEHDRLRSVMLFRFRHFVTGYRSRAIWFSSCGRAPRADVKLQAPCPVWVKLRRTQREQMSSGLPLKADIAQHSRHVSKVPEGDIIGAQAPSLLFSGKRTRVSAIDKGRHRVDQASPDAFGKYAAPHMQEWLFHLITTLASVDVTSLLFAMMFKWLPDVAVDWYDVWLGAVTTAVLFELGKSAIGFYIGKQGLESTYGAAASIIVILIWVYYSSQIILMAAEVTHAFAKHKGSLRNCGPSARSADPLKDRGAINAS